MQKQVSELQLPTTGTATQWKNMYKYDEISAFIEFLILEFSFFYKFRVYIFSWNSLVLRLSKI